MEMTYFTQKEAKQRIGNHVEALFNFPSVPTRSKGIVTKAKLLDNKKWVVRVKWNLPTNSSLIMAQFGEISINFIKKSKIVTDEFCKSEYYQLLKENEFTT